jgi:anaerobic ribonucleoside-triphosphate reductase
MMAVKTRTRCEVWSRVVGYLRPTARWNNGKLAEFGDRCLFKGSC